MRDARIQRNEEQEAEADRREEEAEERADRAEREGGGDQRTRTYPAFLWPPDSAIHLDGHFLGTAEEVSQLSVGLVVEPGEHRLEVVRPAYGTVRRTVTVPAGDRVEVMFDLDKNCSGPSPLAPSPRGRGKGEEGKVPRGYAPSGLPNSGRSPGRRRGNPSNSFGEPGGGTPPNGFSPSPSTERGTGKVPLSIGHSPLSSGAKRTKASSPSFNTNWPQPSFPR